MIASLFVLAAAPALADAASPIVRHANLFISPAGEPFRATPAAPDPVAQWFAKVDKAGQGRIDRAAFRADAKDFFHRLDLNHDGVIDGFEVQAYEEKVAPEILGAYRGGPGSDGHGRRRGGDNTDGAAAVMGGAAPYGLTPAPEPVSSADLSMDGRVSLEEFLAVADRRFDKLDTQQLGYLTLATLPKTPAERAAQKAKPKPQPQPERRDDDRR